MAQIMALSMLGLSGYAIYNRSQKMQSSAFKIPLALPQELSSRKYVMGILNQDASTKALGAELYQALTVMDWGNKPSDYKPPSIDVKFANENITPISYAVIFAMNGLELMQLSNASRINLESTPVIFDLDRRTVMTPISETLIDDVKQYLDPGFTPPKSSPPIPFR